MLWILFALLASLIPQVMAMRINCTAPSPDDDYRAESFAIYQASVNRDIEQGDHPRLFKRRRINIDVYFTVITSGSTLKDGSVEDDSILTQMTVLNQAYRRSGFQFNLKNSIYVDNEKWAHSSGDADLDQRQEMCRRGSYKDLNIVVIPGMSNSGRCTFPTKYSKQALLNDRCEIGTEALPHTGTDALGRVVVHEVGHWLGLMHTFEGGCEGEGDQVDDTPAHIQDNSIEKCPSKAPDTCPDLPGKDPIHNFMSYFEESCWNNEQGFTDGQIMRMQQQWDHFRASAPDTTLS